MFISTFFYDHYRIWTLKQINMKTNYLISVIPVIVLLCSCNNNSDEWPGPADSSVHVKDTIRYSARDTGEAKWISCWLSLPFSGSGANWTAAIHAPIITKEMLNEKRIEVFIKDGNRISGLNYEDQDHWVSQVVEEGKITLFANFNASDSRFLYVITNPFIINDKWLQSDYTVAKKASGRQN